MDTVAVVKTQVDNAHSLLERCIEGLTVEQFHWLPPGTAHSVAATYAHMTVEEDWLIQQFFLGKTTFAEGAWAGKTGLSAPPPGGDWSTWARELRIDPSKLQSFSHAVYAATDAYLAGLKPEDLDRVMQMPFPGAPAEPASTILTQVFVGHANNHIGEIAAVKGLQGLKGYPF